MAWRSTLQASRREVKSPSRSRRDRVTPSSERNKTDGTRTHTPRQLRFARCTARFTVTPSIFLSSGRYSSSTLEQASSDALVALSPSYLQRHSRHTRSKLILPFASSTAMTTEPRVATRARGAKKADADARRAKASVSFIAEKVNLCDAQIF